MAWPGPTSEHYCVDEAGDGTLFSASGRVLIGEEGCSRFFMLGMLQVSEPKALSLDLSALRKRRMSDPYFSGVPSFTPGARKTCVCFHAKNDLPEVRREVFACLVRQRLRFFAVVRDKSKVLAYVRERNERDGNYKYRPNELYDALVRRLFKEKLHKADAYEIVFPRRGKSDRDEALRAALEAARARFTRQWGIESSAKIVIRTHAPELDAGLQAVDYFLWALQRHYARRESRFLKALWPHVRLVHDVDDTNRPYGRYYTQAAPIPMGTLERKQEEGI
jgi:hypothetical protein